MFDGFRRTRYGANGSYSYVTAQNRVECNNDTFGDPIRGERKSCEYNSSPTDEVLFVNCPTIPIEHVAVASGLWSEPTNWLNGAVPCANSDVNIPVGVEITLNVSPPELRNLHIGGKITVLDEIGSENFDLDLISDSIMVMGVFEAGTDLTPIERQLTITLKGQKQDSNTSSTTRGIMVMGDGVLSLHGMAPKPTWTQLSANTNANSTRLELKDEVQNWSTGDQIVVAPTDFFRIGRTESSNIDSVIDGHVLTLFSAIQKPRWGVLQYVNESDAGVTLTPTFSVTEKVIDHRAEVANVSRNIIIQGIDDANWSEEGFGAHVMVMNPGQVYLDGVQFKRVGQAGFLGRYPIHWHIWSYDGGVEIGDADGQYLKNSSIVSSSQRCIVIHATNGLRVENNVCYDIRGHAVFLEDAVERRNTIKNNLVLHTHLPLKGKDLLASERIQNGTGPAGFWLTNPDNTVEGNTVADSIGNGFWLAYPNSGLGPNADVPLDPHTMEFGRFVQNTAHSNRKRALHFDHAPDQDGNIRAIKYDPRTSTGKYSPFALDGFNAYKHESNGDSTTWNRMTSGTLSNFIITDHTGVAFSGASSHCIITDSLVVGRTLNNANPSTSNTEPMGAASYHSDCEISYNIFVNLRGVEGKSSGVFATNDYYMSGVDLGLRKNAANILINSHPGYRELSPNNFAPNVQARGSTMGQEHFAFSGALWDPYGYWGPEGNYWVYDIPFLTDGTYCETVLDDFHGNDRSCEGPYYGVSGKMRLDNEDVTSSDYHERPIKITRIDNNTEWFIDDGGCTPFLGIMRHFATVKGGTYRVSFPGGQNSAIWNGTSLCSDEELAQPPVTPTAISFNVSNFKTDSDVVILAVPLQSQVSPKPYMTSLKNSDYINKSRNFNDWQNGAEYAGDDDYSQSWRPLIEVSTYNELEAASGAAFWQDSDNDLVWIRIMNSGMTPNEDGNIVVVVEEP